ncbi:hypothetical protein ABD76_17185 [Paenibacillus dendritiformis]|nr:hypothetical protein [Paenibacillus dendritiformis]
MIEHASKMELYRRHLLYWNRASIFFPVIFQYPIVELFIERPQRIQGSAEDVAPPIIIEMVNDLLRLIDRSNASFFDLPKIAGLFMICPRDRDFEADAAVPARGKASFHL